MTPLEAQEFIQEHYEEGNEAVLDAMDVIIGHNVSRLEFEDFAEGLDTLFEDSKTEPIDLVLQRFLHSFTMAVMEMIGRHPDDDPADLLQTVIEFLLDLQALF